MNIAEPFLRQAMAAPALAALAWGARTWTYGQLVQEVAQVAVALRAQGVGRGDCVAVIVPGAPAIVATLALASLGAVSADVSAAMPAKDAAPLLEGWGVNYVFHCWDNDLELRHPALKLQARKDVIFPAEDAAAGRAPLRLAQVAGSDVWRIGVSSGTTGERKGIAYTHEASHLNALLQRAVFPVGPGDRFLVGMGAAMSFAVHNWLRCLYAGACVVIPKRFDAGVLLALAHDDGITQMSTTPGMAMDMVAAARSSGSRLGQPPASLRSLTVGGSKVTPQLHEALRRHLCPGLYINYGSAESGLLAVLDPALYERAPDCSGRLVPWVRAQAVDERGKPLAMGQEGLLRFASPTLGMGYVGAVAPADPSAGPQGFRDGWFHSNDVGAVTMGGVIRLAGRANDVINLGGFKLDPQRLEDLLVQDPAIVDCAVTDVPGALGQTAVGVLVVAPQGVDVESVRARCMQLAPNCAPQLVVTVKSIPRNEAGKVRRKRVREIALDAVARSQAGGSPPAPELRP